MRYDRLVAPDSFIGRYMAACEPLETARAYDFWGALWALGTVLGRGVYIPRPHAPIYMNWYVIFAGESGITRKSTAVRMSRDIVRQFLPAECLIEGKSTPEYLFGRLQLHPHTAISVSELVTFLGRESYVLELPALLTDLYDCPAEKRGGSVSRGDSAINNAYVTFMSASTPSWLLSAVNPSVIEGGFTSRCMFVHATEPKHKVAWPADAHGLQGAIDVLRDIRNQAAAIGEIRLMPAAMRRYELWYKKRDTVTTDVFLASFHSREDSHVLRCAACLAINDGRLAIDKRDIDAAIKVIAEVKRGATAIFSQQGSVTKTAQAIDKITRMLIEAGGVGVGHTPLYAACRYYVTAQDFKIIIDLMNELGMIYVGIEQSRAPGRKPVRYFRTPEIVQKERMRALTEALK